MAELDRDRSLDRLLRQTLSGGAMAPAAGACVDSETLAAWTAGALRAGDASAIERHVADCDRCQAMLAAFVRTTPADPAIEPLWRRWRLPWLVPLATAATAVALWMALPGDRPGAIRPESEGQSAARPEALAVAQTQAPPPAFARDEVAESRAANESGERPGSQLPAVPAPSESIDGLARPERENRVANGARVGGDLDSKPGADALGKVTAVDAKKEVAPAAQALAAVRQAPALEIVAPDAATRWRITDGSRIDRSTPAGSWEPVTLSSPGVLTAGSAASSTVCWIVGRAGAVYMTPDGVRFTRVPFPEVIDLVAVRATDDRSATVTASDGRSWRTADQGRTWLAVGG